MVCLIMHCNKLPDSGKIIEYLKSTNDANALELITYFQTKLDYEIEMLRFFT